MRYMAEVPVRDLIKQGCTIREGKPLIVYDCGGWCFVRLKNADVLLAFFDLREGVAMPNDNQCTEFPIDLCSTYWPCILDTTP